MSCACALAFRSIVSTAIVEVAASSVPLLSMRDHPRIALSGVRNSCESVARNSSLSRPASCACSRASRSRVSSRSRSASTRFRAEMSRCVPHARTMNPFSTTPTRLFEKYLVRPSRSVSTDSASFRL